MKNYSMHCQIKESNIFQILNNNKINGGNGFKLCTLKGLPYLTRTSVEFSGLKNTYNLLFFATERNKVMDRYF